MVDVTPLLGEAFTDQLAARRQAMWDLRPRLARLQRQAARLWGGLQDPVALAPGTWLRVKPLAVALAPPRVREYGMLK